MSDNQMKKIHAPFDDATARSLRAGDRVLISGTILAARDAAHKRLVETLDRGDPLPVDLKGAVVYYVGPSPARSLARRAPPLRAEWMPTPLACWTRGSKACTASTAWAATRWRKPSFLAALWARNWWNFCKAMKPCFPPRACSRQCALATRRPPCLREQRQPRRQARSPHEA